MFHPVCSERLNGLSSAVFSEIDALRRAEEAKGRDIITLSIGSPDLAPAPHIVDALCNAAREGHQYRYALSRGKSELLEAMAQWYQDKFDVTLCPETEVHTLMGSQDGLAHIALCLLNPGDVVLVPDPGYPIFSAGPLVAGAELYHMALRKENEFLPDLAAIPADIRKRAKLMILNYPNNPLAAVANEEFFCKVVAFAQQNEIVVCHDFAYSELVFDGYRPPSFLATPGAKEVGIEFHSLSKTYNMAGCRVGFALGNAEVISYLGRLKSNFDYGIFLPVQEAAIAALRGPQQAVQDTAAIYQRRRDLLIDGLGACGWQIPKPKGTMFVWAPVPTKETSMEFTLSWLREAGVAVVPGSAFGPQGEGYVRIALVEEEASLQKAVDRTVHWLKKS